MTARKKPARGRPPRADKAATERLEIRLTKLERADIEHKAALAGLSVSEWIRRAIFGLRDVLTVGKYDEEHPITKWGRARRELYPAPPPREIAQAQLDLQRALEVSDRRVAPWYRCVKLGCCALFDHNPGSCPHCGSDVAQAYP